MDTSIIKRILNIVYPARCPFCDIALRKTELYLCEKCAGSFEFSKAHRCIYCCKVLFDSYTDICEDCLSENHSYDEAFSPFLYGGEVKEAIVRFKYRGRPEYAAFFARCIFEYGKERIGRWEPDALIPVPIHSSRLAKRGYNQAELLARELSKLTEIRVETALIKRTKKTLAQKELSPLERRENLRSAFEYRGEGKVPKKLVIVDDIVTTGSTADAVSSLLKRQGAERVYLVSIA